MSTATAATAPSVLEMELALEALLLSTDEPSEGDIHLVRDAGLWRAETGGAPEAAACGKLVRHFSHAVGEERYPVVTATLRADSRCARVVLLEDTGETIPIPIDTDN